MFARDPHKVLSVDFIEEDKKKRQALADDIPAAVYRTFLTVEGQKTMRFMEDLVGVRLIETNVHQTVANAARREFLDVIKEAQAQGAPT